MKKLYIVFDARHSTDPDSSTILLTTRSKEEAGEYSKDYPGSVIEVHKTPSKKS